MPIVNQDIDINIGGNFDVAYLIEIVKIYDSKLVKLKVTKPNNDFDYIMLRESDVMRINYNFKINKF